MAEFLVQHYGFTRLAIGDQIKKTANMMIEDIELLYQYLEEMMPEYKEQIFNEFHSYKKANANAEFIKQGNFYLKNEAYRGLTQITGDIVRSRYGPEVWISIMLKEADKVINANGKVVCDDVRLKVEKDRFETEDYTIFKLNIDPDVQRERIIEMYQTYDPKALEHKTETDLDDVVFPAAMTFDTSLHTKKECYQLIENRLTV